MPARDSGGTRRPPRTPPGGVALGVAYNSISQLAPTALLLLAVARRVALLRPFWWVSPRADVDKMARLPICAALSWGSFILGNGAV
jgi:hypothetical protein